MLYDCSADCCYLLSIYKYVPSISNLRINNFNEKLNSSLFFTNLTLTFLTMGESSLSKTKTNLPDKHNPSHKQRKQPDLPYKPYHPQPQLPSIQHLKQSDFNKLPCFSPTMLLRKLPKLVIKLFVSRKTNQAGKRFGFVTIHSNLSDKLC